MLTITFWANDPGVSVCVCLLLIPRTLFQASGSIWEVSNCIGEKELAELGGSGYKEV